MIHAYPKDLLAQPQDLQVQVDLSLLRKSKSHS
jgi:hypothetical protein